MCKLDSIVFRREIIFKRQCFIAFPWVIFIIKIVFFVEDVKSFPSPCVLALFIASLRVYDGLHADVIQRLRLILDSKLNTKLTMLNLAMKLLRLLVTLKLNHCVKPLVLISFWRRRS